MLTATVTGVVERWRAKGDPDTGALWAELGEAGLTAVGIAEERGGSGGSLADVVEIVRAAAVVLAPVPLAEHLLASWIAERAGAGPLPGRATVAWRDGDVEAALLGDEPPGSGDWRAPWADAAEVAVAFGPAGDGSAVSLVGLDGVTSACDMSGTPVGHVRVDAEGTSRCGLPFVELLARFALLRSAQLVGTLELVADWTVRYAKERSQFGRPLAEFQAVQHHLARAAGELAVADAAVRLAVEADGTGTAVEAVAAAKVRVGEAAGRVAASAHQVHGAIGFTDEHPLHLATTRLWTWRDDAGDERTWSAWLGRSFAAGGGTGLWPAVTAVGATEPGASR